jgi:hypothetical protein
MKHCLAILLLAAAPALAEDWVPVTPANADATLRERTLVYDDGSTQDFRADGGTTYTHDDKPSEGRWGIRDGRYCSVWPPSDHWACYDLAVSGDGLSVRFTDDSGGTTVGKYEDRD